jgi:hypothetical protein
VIKYVWQALIWIKSLRSGNYMRFNYALTRFSLNTSSALDITLKMVSKGPTSQACGSTGR